MTRLAAVHSSVGPRWRTWVAVIALLCPAHKVLGEVLDITAAITSEARELTGGEQTGMDTSIEQFPETSPVLPMHVFAALGDLVEGPPSEHGARGLADFDEPMLEAGVNPAELGLEAACFSLDVSVDHEVESRAEESRQIVLESADLRPVGVGARNAQSTLYISGAVLMWADDTLEDLSELASTLSVHVFQTRADSTEETLLEINMALRGTPDGSVHLTDNELLETMLGDAELITSLLGDEFADAVEALESLGRVHVLLIPEQTVEYRYAVEAGEPFALRLETAVRVAETPGGSGVAAVFGRPFQAIPDALPPRLSPRTTGRIQNALNEAARVRSAVGGQMPDPSAPLCGAMGVEMILLSLTAFPLVAAPWRRRAPLQVG